MTSTISRDDLEDALVHAGIASPYVRSRLMRLIELYARKYPQLTIDDIPPVNMGDYQGYQYKCKECGERKYIGEFPEYKKINPRSPIACLSCRDKVILTAQSKAAIMFR